jgi:hypothetical protein
MIRDFRIDTSGFCQRGGVWLNAADSRSAGTYAPSPVQIRALALAIPVKGGIVKI